jgi:hypothetical protein
MSCRLEFGHSVGVLVVVGVRLVDLIEGEVEPLGDGFGVEPSLFREGADASDRQPTALDVGLVFDFRDDSSSSSLITLSEDVLVFQCPHPAPGTESPTDPSGAVRRSLLIRHRSPP